MNTVIDSRTSIGKKAADFHEMLDQFSDQLDASVGYSDRLTTVTNTRQKIESLRIHIRLLRRARSGSLDDLKAGITLSLGEIERLLSDLDKSSRSGRKE